MSYNSLADDYEALGDDLVPRLLPAGTYNATIKKATAGQTAKGKDKLSLTFEVTEGVEAGMTAMDQLYWSPENAVAARITAETLAKLGATPEYIKTVRPSWEELAEYITGAQVEISVKIEEYNGNDTNRVNIRRPLGGSPAKSQTTAQAAPTLGAPAAPAQQAAVAAQAAPAQQGAWPGL